MKKKTKKHKVQRCGSKSAVFLFFIIIMTTNNQDFNRANMKLHNGGALGLVQVEMCQVFHARRCKTLQWVPSGLFFSILLFAFSATKRPVKELRLSFMSGEKYMNKIFLLF